MEAKAMAKTIRIAPRKTRLVVDLVRGKQVGEAMSILKLTPKAASPVVEKVVKSAAANAVNNFGMDVNNLYIKEAYVGEGRGGSYDQRPRRHEIKSGGGGDGGKQCF